MRSRCLWLGVAAVPLLVAGCGLPPKGAVFHSEDPPPVPQAAGTMSPAQAARAETAVRLFLTGLSRDPAAATQTMAAAARGCLHAPGYGTKVTITSLRILSARPAGKDRATVLFQLTARLALPGGAAPQLVSIGSDRRPAWLAAVAVNGNWYVNPGRWLELLSAEEA